MFEYLKLIAETFSITFLLMIILEFAGRKSITQFSIIQVVVFVSIGEVALLPLYQEDFNIFHTIVTSITFVVFLVLFEWLEVKFNWIENLLSKKAIVIIENGKVDYEKLRKQRMSIDQLESKLRLKGIANFEMLKTATIEINGDIGYEYKSDYAPITKFELLEILNKPTNNNDNFIGNNMFEEIEEGHKIKHEDKYN